jgi:hypothetical protein
MRQTTVALVAVLLLGATPAIAAGELYRCSARDVVQYKDDGTIGKFEKTADDFWLKHWTNFLVDTATGLIGKGSGMLDQWFVTQKGGSANDFVASPGPGPLSAETNVLRVRACRSLRDRPVDPFQDAWRNGHHNLRSTGTTGLDFKVVTSVDLC